MDSNEAEAFKRFVTICSENEELVKEFHRLSKRAPIEALVDACTDRSYPTRFFDFCQLLWQRTPLEAKLELMGS